jgi:hypothetical protein
MCEESHWPQELHRKTVRITFQEGLAQCQVFMGAFGGIFLALFSSISPFHNTDHHFI